MKKLWLILSILVIASLTLVACQPQPTEPEVEEPAVEEPTEAEVEEPVVEETTEEFDTENIVQFGWMNQWTDPRGIGTFFGAGSLVDENGDAQIPEHWVEAWKWTYDGWWEDWFIPNGAYGGADFLQGPGGPFTSGNLAMIHMHMWYVAPWALGDVPFDWGLAATPAYEGTVTSKMHADTFGILKGSDHPEEAFQVLTYMLSEEHANELLTIYGGMPARLSLQPDYFDQYEEANFPDKDINWDVVVDSMAYADKPNHESWMPSFQETTDRYNEFWNKLANTPDLDVDEEIEILLQDLQTIFEAAEEVDVDEVEEEEAEEVEEEETEEAEESSEKVQIRWFIGLGAGSDEPTFEPQNAFVERFNASQDEIELVIEIVDNDVAYDTLATQIAAGNAPDIVGPVGIRGRDSFKGAWMDLTPLIEANDYDLSDFDPNMVEFYRVQEEGQLGIPFAIYPSFVIYNKDLFDEAGAPYPPAEYGEPYVDQNGEEKPWNIETLTELAKFMTVDANGNDATMIED